MAMNCNNNIENGFAEIKFYTLCAELNNNTKE